MAQTATMTSSIAHKRELSHSEQAYQILHLGFTAAPILFGLDKFLGLTTNWDQYLAPWMKGLLPFAPHTFMLIVGVVEMAAGVIVWVKPKFGAYLVAAWLSLIIVNLLSGAGFYDVALRDFGLMLGALALGRLSQEFA